MDPIDHWMEKLRFLTYCSENSAKVQKTLSTLSPPQLYAVCLLSRKHCEWVSVMLDCERLSVQQSAPSRSISPVPDALPHLRLAVSLAEHRVSWTRPRQTLGISSEALRASATALLAKFGLQFEETQLLLSATDSAISGSAVTSLLPLRQSFEPNDLDFFTRSGRGQGVVKFLQMPGLYELTNTAIAYGVSAGIGTIWTLIHRIHGYKINVIEGLTNNPLDAILRFHSTCVIGAWSASGIWHAYPFYTVSGKSLTTWNMLPLTGALTPLLDHHKIGWRVLHKYINRGFSFDVGELRSEHVCGVDWNCPATVRRSDDAGCLFAPFPSWRLSSDDQLPLTAWTLGGVSCDSGLEDGSGRSIRPVYSEKNSRWIRSVDSLINRSTEPMIFEDIHAII
ncbi:hypothetical protein C8R43DRAFT_660134 [Mycena crocata]|nr:hypothetical protein C8R43DRAFT_660134 [Mycena crocata]